MKKNLIYYTSVGEEYAFYTIASINSVLRYGNYKDDIFIFCDRGEYFSEFYENDNIHIFVVGETSPNDAYVLRVMVGVLKMIPTENYEQIMYIDSDILCAKDISSLFCAKGSLRYVTEDTTRLMDNDKECAFSNFYFTNNEFEQIKKNKIINSGFWCIDAELFSSLMGAWYSMLQSKEHPKNPVGMDQSAFNKIIYTGLIEPAFEYLERFIHLDNLAKNEQTDIDNLKIDIDFNRYTLYHATCRVNYPFDKKYIFENIFHHIVRYYKSINTLGNTLPLVSCMMLTKNKEYLKDAIISFLNQDYKEKELVILAKDKELFDYICQLFPTHINNNIFVHIAGQQKTLGEKRNFVLSKCKGDYVASWDDDDIYSSERIKIQMNEIFKSKKTACVFQRITLWDRITNERKLISRLDRGFENTIIFKKYKIVEYPALNFGEDTAVFLMFFFAKQVCFLDGATHFTYVYHGENTVSYNHYKNIFNTPFA